MNMNVLTHRNDSCFSPSTHHSQSSMHLAILHILFLFICTTCGLIYWMYATGVQYFSQCNRYFSKKLTGFHRSSTRKSKQSSTPACQPAEFEGPLKCRTCSPSSGFAAKRSPQSSGWQSSMPSPSWKSPRSSPAPSEASVWCVKSQLITPLLTPFFCTRSDSLQHFAHHLAGQVRNHVLLGLKTAL